MNIFESFEIETNKHERFQIAQSMGRLKENRNKYINFELTFGKIRFMMLLTFLIFGVYCLHLQGIVHNPNAKHGFFSM